MDIDDIKKKKESRLFDFDTLDYYLDVELAVTTNHKVYSKLMELYYKDYKRAKEYFFTKSIALGNKRPYDLCLDNKKEEVYTELVRIEHGIFS